MSRLPQFALLTILVQIPRISSDMEVNNGGGEIIRGLPCIKKLNQLFCPQAGTTYPSKFIDKFIDENKALMRRMYGELQETTTVTRTTVRVVRTFNGVSSYAVSAPLTAQFTAEQRFRRDVLEGTLEEMTLSVEQQDRPVNSTHSTSTEQQDLPVNSTRRERRQADFPGNPETNTNKEDVCESKTEIVTPFWASNSNGKVRAILNNKAFEQAIHQEICSQSSTVRCTRDCSCEQKYKWHRLLAYDPNNDCAGVFMDWFLFPSCCVCRCNKNPFLNN